ncbi:MAG: M4 family metallopeptidase [Acidimicrobiales bacterium]
MGGTLRVRRSVAVLLVALVVPAVAGIAAGGGPVASASPAAVDDGSPPMSSGSPTSAQQRLVDELQQVGSGSVVVQRSSETGAVVLLAGSLDEPLTTQSTADHAGAARSFIDRYAPLFGVDEAGESLVETRRTAIPDGGTAVRFEQRFAGLPVFAAAVSVQVGSDGRVLSTMADTLPSSAVGLSPAVPAEAAAVTASGLVAGGVVSGAPRLEVYDPVVVGASGAPGARLVWAVEVVAGAVRELVLVDGRAGGVVLHFDQTPHAKDRRVCDNQSDPARDEYCFASGAARVEGGPATGVAEVDRTYDLLGATYDYFWTRFGRDSIDGAGMPLVATVDYCTSAMAGCPYHDAYWGQDHVVFGAGLGSTDDVLAHELTHGITERTSGLVYFGQSGAISESMSDVFGELVDQATNTAWDDDTPAARWRLGEDWASGGTRSMANPPEHNQPDRMGSPLFSDTNLDRAGVHVNSGVGNKAAFLMADGGSFNGQTVTGLGVDETARIFYLVETAYLLPGSSYADLGAALVEACSLLIGSHGITSTDCQNVVKVVAATDLRRAPNGAAYHPLVPTRILDSRPPPEQVGPYGIPWWPGETRAVKVTDAAVEMYYASAVVLNVTVTGATATSHLTLWPHGVARPVASNLNFVAGQTVPNLVTVQVGDEGWIEVFNSAGFVNVVADVVGYYDDDAFAGSEMQAPGVQLTAVTPFRLLDSRDGTGTSPAPWSAGESRDVQITGVPGSGVPTISVTGVVLNVTAVNPSAESFLSVWPAGAPRPLASNLNFPAGRTIPNLVVAKLGSGGKVTLFNNSGSVDVVADVVGYYSLRPSGGRLTAVTPTRVLDSRPPPEQVGPDGTPWGPGQTRTVAVAGLAGVPPQGVSAVVLNVTAVNPTADSHLTLWDTGVAMPTASNLNFRAGDVIPNLVVVKVGTGNTISVFNNRGSVDVLVDLVGYFS